MACVLDKQSLPENRLAVSARHYVGNGLKRSTVDTFVQSLIFSYLISLAHCPAMEAAISTKASVLSGLGLKFVLTLKWCRYLAPGLTYTIVHKQLKLYYSLSVYVVARLFLLHLR